jgi:HTH-type transcriptional regulator/antitoxin HipB
MGTIGALVDTDAATWSWESEVGSTVERRWMVRSGTDLGAAVAEVRRARGLTQAEVAEQVGLSRHWLAKLETGRSAVVLDHLLRILRRLGATVVITFDVPDGTAGEGANGGVGEGDPDGTA